MDFSFVGGAYEAPSLIQDAQELINWYPEIDPTKPEGERGVIALYPTPGLPSALVCPQAGVPVRGFRVIPGGSLLLAVCGNTLYSITTNYVATAVGTLQPNTGMGRVYITDNGVAAYLTDGSNRYTYTWGTNTFALVATTDGAFTGGNVCDITDNFIIYNRPNSNQFGCTNVGDIISGATNVGSKIGAPDNIVSLIAWNRYISLLGEKTSETWQDVGTFPFPFAIIPGASMQHGCAAQDSVARFGETIAFLARDDRGRNVVVQMVGFAPKRISTHAVENAISKYSTTSDAIGMSYQQGGHEFYLLTFPIADVTWCYDLATQLWHKRAWRDPNNILHRHRANCIATFNGQVIVGDWENGNIYAFSQTTYTDNGVAIPCIRRCPHLTQDLRWQFFHQLQIQFQPGVGLQSGQGSDPVALLRWSDDGGSTYGNVHTANIGKVGAYKNRCQWQRLGSARDRIFEVTVTDPVYRVIVSANLNASPGVA